MSALSYTSARDEHGLQRRSWIVALVYGAALLVFVVAHLVDEQPSWRTLKFAQYLGLTACGFAITIVAALLLSRRLRVQRARAALIAILILELVIICAMTHALWHPRLRTWEPLLILAASMGWAQILILPLILLHLSSGPSIHRGYFWICVAAAATAALDALIRIIDFAWFLSFNGSTWLRDRLRDDPMRFIELSAGPVALLCALLCLSGRRTRVLGTIPLLVMLGPRFNSDLWTFVEIVIGRWKPDLFQEAQLVSAFSYLLLTSTPLMLLAAGSWNFHAATASSASAGRGT